MDRRTIFWNFPSFVTLLAILIPCVFLLSGLIVQLGINYFDVIDTNTWVALNNTKYDFIIVGGGTTGSALASELSKDSQRQVLLLEAGGRPSLLHRFLSDVPLLVPLLFGSSHDWFYLTTPQTNAATLINDKRVVIPSGKMLGGTAMLNAMVVNRGHPSDYDNWKIAGWTYEDLKLELFASNSTCQVSEEPVYLSSVTKLIANSFYKATKHFEGSSHKAPKSTLWSIPGSFRPLVAVNRGRRSTTFSACLEPIEKRSNLKIVTSCLVDKVEMSSNTPDLASGVAVIHGNQRFHVALKSKGEVILSAGSVSSPAILLRSGIGPKKHFHKFPEIEPLAYLPVGENLHDHVSMNLFVMTNYTAGSISPRRILNPRQILRYLMHKEGLWSQAFGLSNIAYVRTPIQKALDLPAPDIQYYVFGVGSVNERLKYVSNYPDLTWQNYYPKNYGEGGFFVMTILLNPKSRGNISLASKDPHVPPNIDPNYFAEDIDLIRMREGLKILITSLEESQDLQRIDARIHFPRYRECSNFPLKSDDYLDCVIRGTGHSGYHLSGSCKMAEKGSRDGVVLPNLKVQGFQNLRVADASILPTLISGNPNAILTTIAKKTSENILTKFP